MWVSLDSIQQNLFILRENQLVTTKPVQQILLCFSTLIRRKPFFLSYIVCTDWQWKLKHQQIDKHWGLYMIKCLHRTATPSPLEELRRASVGDYLSLFLSLSLLALRLVLRLDLSSCSCKVSAPPSCGITSRHPLFSHHHHLWVKRCLSSSIGCWGVTSLIFGKCSNKSWHFYLNL